MCGWPQYFVHRAAGCGQNHAGETDSDDPAADVAEEAIETTRIHSAGVLEDNRALVGTRPFRSPHHTISDAGLIGGGAVPRLGGVSLGHNGVLFLDELPEFQQCPGGDVATAGGWLGDHCPRRGLGDISLALHARRRNESLPLRIFWRSDARMPLYAADDRTLYIKDFRAASGSNRYSNRSAIREI